MNELRVRVTRDDIRKGVRDNENFCPIARALRRKGFERVSVSRYSATIGRKKEVYDLEWNATDFIDSFDVGLKVSPAVFTLTKEQN